MENDNPNLTEQRERIDNALISAVDDIDREHLRKLQLEMHTCAKRCCSDVDASAEIVQSCVDRCQLPLTRARCYVQQELAVFETQLEHCMRDCKMPNDEETNTSGLGGLSGHGLDTERCTLECVDKYVTLLPDLLSAMRMTLEKEGL